MYDEPESPHEGDVFKQKQKPFGLSEPVIKTLCLQMGGGAAPPPNPPLSFYAVQACFEEHRTINKNCLKQIVVIGLFKPFMQADGGATSRPTLVRFSSVQDRFKYHPAS